MQLNSLEIPKDWYPLDTYVSLTVYVMCVVRVPFFVTYSRVIKFATAKSIPKHDASRLTNSPRKICMSTHEVVFMSDWH